MNRKYSHSLAYATLGVALAAAAFLSLAQTPAGEPISYPARGQDAKQQDQDRYQCHDWARSQSGFDPTRAMEAAPAASAARAAAPTSTDPTGGMAKGAITGAAIGEVSRHDAGRAAAVGALGGGLMTKLKEQRARQQAGTPQPSAANPRLQQKTSYDRAFAACLEGRGYTVR